MGGLKKSVDIEQLLQWAYLDELPKRQTSSAEGIWDRLAQNGSLGGINPDPGHGSAQRYAHFGLPHPDAERIEAAVTALQSVVIDWPSHFEMIAGDLAALISVNDVSGIGLRSHIPGGGSGFGKDHFKRATMKPVSVLRDGKLVKAYRAEPDRRRDVLLVNTVNVAALVSMYAVRKSRPDWRTEQMRPVPTVAERGNQGLATVIGKNRGKNYYTTGSYCPLIWTPSPIEVALTRADYVAWRQGLMTLIETLNLSDHVALPPSAPAMPWFEGEAAQKPARIHRQPYTPSKVLPLNPQRNRARAPLKNARNSKAQRVRVDRESIR